MFYELWLNGSLSCFVFLSNKQLLSLKQTDHHLFILSVLTRNSKAYHVISTEACVLFISFKDVCVCVYVCVCVHFHPWNIILLVHVARVWAWIHTSFVHQIQCSLGSTRTMVVFDNGNILFAYNVLIHVPQCKVNYILRKHET